MGILCVVGVYLSYNLVGWLTKPNDKDNRRKR